MIELKKCLISLNDNFQLNIENLKLEQGKRYLIIGKSGSGKSTLVKVLSGLISFKGNLFRIDNGVTLQSTCKQYRSALMYLSQEFSLWEHLSVEKHINFTLSRGKTLKKQNDTDFYLDFVNLLDKRKCRPYQLSGGEKQRLALARALATKAKYLFLDEPFANIDAVGAYMLIEKIKKLQKTFDFSLVEVTHYLIKFNDTNAIIIVLDDGKIIFKGTYLQLVNLKNKSKWLKQWQKLVN